MTMFWKAHLQHRLAFSQITTKDTSAYSLTCLVYVSTYCVPMALVRQNKPFDYSIWAAPK